MNTTSALRHESMVVSPFCDYLNVTTPKENQEALLQAIQPILDALGYSDRGDGLFALQGHGTFKAGARGKVSVFSASGGFLDMLRMASMYGDYLAAIAAFPHRVSMLHATADFRVDAPEVMQSIKAMGYAGEVKLTRKAVTPEHVTSVFTPDYQGRETGTVYLGNRKNADVWAKVYDKGHERRSRGFVDPGQLVRVEIAVQSDMGATLRDASNPTDLFFQFASPSLVTLPEGQLPWVSMGEGFVVPKQQSDLTGVQRIKGVISNSPDFKRVFALAVEHYGEEAKEALLQVVGRAFALSIQKSSIVV